jgi:hypothetical protein
MLAAMLIAGPAPLLAQESEGTVTPTDAQEDYNNQGVILIQDGKYKEAIASFRSSLSLGELNITYLNLGRAYFRLDRCLEAREAYDAVKTAPKVKAPTPDEIQTLLQKFEADYAETCTATLAISCEGDPQVSVDDQPARPCSEVSAWPTTPGEHVVKAEYENGTVEETVTVEGRSAAAVAFAAPEVIAETPEPDEADPVVAEPVEPAQSANKPLYLYPIMATGAAIVVGAVVWDIAVVGGQLAELEDLEDSLDGSDADEAELLREDIDMSQTITFIAAGVGAATLITGGVLWLLTGDDEPAQSSVGPMITSDGGGVVWQGRF